MLIATTAMGALLAACGSGGTASAPAPATAQAGPNANRVAATSGDPAPDTLKPVWFPDAELDADDQVGQGDRVVIEETTLPVPGHLAVYDQTGLRWDRYQCSRVNTGTWPYRSIPPWARAATRCTPC
ncbi:hypothetical protein AOZ06_24105 [Kibdelosporangium phytohabitans]|uniref:NlpC/P60 domain-containing protein n=2 Tax=Kibdelosporangium phytohabitans TaxID=860235 RepID=A0A0N9I449_9PSEU|nr:hypothetical protein AOZ06_24105 [Kibdelosporangium phytohabitans]